MNYVYFAKSLKNKKVYVGHTSKDPSLRIREHNQRSNKFTSQNGPFISIYYEAYFCNQDAVRREKFYKMGFGKQVKKAIINCLPGTLSSAG